MAESVNPVQQKKRSGLIQALLRFLFIFLYLFISYSNFLQRYCHNIVKKPFSDKKIDVLETSKTPILRWLRRLDLNQRPSGYEGFTQEISLILSLRHTFNYGCT